MNLDCEVLTGMPYPDRLSATHDLQNSQSAFFDHIWSRCDLTFDLKRK